MSESKREWLKRYLDVDDAYLDIETCDDITIDELYEFHHDVEWVKVDSSSYHEQQKAFAEQRREQERSRQQVPVSSSGVIGQIGPSSVKPHSTHESQSRRSTSSGYGSAFLAGYLGGVVADSFDGGDCGDVG